MSKKPTESANGASVQPVCSAARVPLEDIAESFNGLHSALLTGEGLPARPFWLEVGNSGYKITDANRDNIALGMLLALDVRGYLRR